ncbi:hypothetical protein OE88DRAFT_212745 [Heliocybe sulcata]|uniref:Uncharacterized protein n=1 Tax=Heliocybe sulcata TaxID=5364 RepID=A0A5C3N001_9AGAM|nr:hypothetical protein OE88DRAFT_212745 [Heliocybe sulcata]
MIQQLPALNPNERSRIRIRRPSRQLRTGKPFVHISQGDVLRRIGSGTLRVVRPSEWTGMPEDTCVGESRYPNTDFFLSWKQDSIGKNIIMSGSSTIIRCSYYLVLRADLALSMQLLSTTPRIQKLGVSESRSGLPSCAPKKGRILLTPAISALFRKLVYTRAPVPFGHLGRNP